MTTTELIEILVNAEQSVSKIDFDKYLYKVLNDRLVIEMSDEMNRKLIDSNIRLEELGIKIIPFLTKDMNKQGLQGELMVENSKIPFATISFDEVMEQMTQKNVDKKVQEYELDADEIRNKAIDEVFDFLKKQRDVRYMKVRFDDFEIRRYKEQLKGE